MTRREAALALLAVAFAPNSGAQSKIEFDAAAAWAEFETLVRQSYAYADRPGISCDVILSTFAAQAKAAQTDTAFIDVLQLVARNFADPHFVVGPFDANDWAVIPTGSDLVAEASADGFVISAVRSGSAAAIAGIKPGDLVDKIDDDAPHLAIEAVMGRPIDQLSRPQVDFGLNTALAGRWDKPRAFTINGEAIALAATSTFVRALRALPTISAERRGKLAIFRFNNKLGDTETIAAFRAALSQNLDARRLLLDLRNTPSGGNTTVARAIMGHFTDRERPYQTHTIPYDARLYDAPRKFTEFVLPVAPRFRGSVAVAGGHWTGSMGEGLMVGFDALGVLTVGSDLADLLGGISNLKLQGSAARIDLSTEALFHVDGRPREQFRPRRFVADCEPRNGFDPVLGALGWA